jgi:hypothetical protein
MGYRDTDDAIRKETSMKKSGMPNLIHMRKLVIPDNFESSLPNDYDETFLMESQE